VPLTKIGYAGIPKIDWWTQMLPPVLGHDTTTRKIVWLYVWRNSHEHPGGFLSLIRIRGSTNDFKKSRERNLMLFENELPDM